jgi:hypothetical protein
VALLSGEGVGDAAVGGERMRARLLLALLFALMSEVAVWRDPSARAALDLLLIPAYLILATLVLDLAARYRVRDGFGVLLLAGIYALLNALSPNPALMGANPATLAAQVLGTQALAGLAALCALRWWGKRRGWQSAPQLPNALWWAGAASLVVIGIIRAAALSTLDISLYVFAAVLLLLCWAMLWYQRSEKAAPLFFTGIMQLRRDTLLLLPLLLMALVFVASSGIVAALRDPLSVAFTAVGLVWLPTVALVIGLRALRREARAMRL